jgi:hypothetical protein
MKIIIIIIFLLIIVIFLHKKIQQETKENLDPSISFSQEGLYNLLSSYNSIQINNTTPTNSILGSLNLNGKIDISNNINVINNIKSGDISANNIISNNINLSTFDFNRYKICLKNKNNCINPNLISLYSKINDLSSSSNNMYLSDSLNCEIFEPASFRNATHNYIPKRILSQFGFAKSKTTYIKPTINDISGNINLNDLPELGVTKWLNNAFYIYGINASQSPYLFPKPAYYFLPQNAEDTPNLQQDYDNSCGFKITIPQLPFKCQVIWIQVPMWNSEGNTIKFRTNRSFRVTYSEQISNSPIDVIHSTHKVGVNSLMPDGSDYNSIQVVKTEYTQWVPIPIIFDQMQPSDRSLYLRRNRTEEGNTFSSSVFMISGIAFTTNPWNHCKTTPFCLEFDLNRNQNNDNTNRTKKNSATTLSFDNISDYVSIDGKLFTTKLPVINNNKDKLLYLNIKNDTINANILGVYVSIDDPIQLGNQLGLGNLSSTAMFEETEIYTNLVANNKIQKLNNFTTTYDNPFARYFNSQRGNRYISTIIPYNMITSNFIYIILQSQITTGTSLTIREMGTHDLIPSL